MEDKNYISKSAKIFEFVTLEAPVKLYGTARINRESSIGRFSYVDSRTTIFPKTTIGRYCSIGKDSQIGVIAHPVEWLSTSPIQYNMAYHFPDYSKGFAQKEFDRPMQTTLGNDVWVGAMVIIKRGVTIGDGAIVGAGAVVTKDVPPYAIVGGVPAKIIRYRFPDKTIKKLLSYKWWDFPYEKLLGLDFEDIDKVIRQLQEIRKALPQDKPKRWRVYHKDEGNKLIAVSKLDVYLQKGWIRGKKPKLVK